MDETRFYDWRCIMLLRAAAAFMICVAVTACSTANSAKMDGAEPSAHEAMVPTGTLTGAQTTQVLSDRNFTFLFNGVKGSITFHGDGTLDYRAPVAGKGTGVWKASDGSLCQTLNPTHFLPQGTRAVCYAFVSTGQIYIWGKTQYITAAGRL